jgi:hypothetical protein
VHLAGATVRGLEDSRAIALRRHEKERVRWAEPAARPAHAYLRGGGHDEVPSG